MTEALFTVLAVAGFAVALAICWLLTVFGLPGTWLMVAAAACYAWLMPPDARWSISWELIGGLAAIALVAEIAETMAAARSTSRLGGSRRGAVLAIIGSIIGGIFATGLIPIPIVGTIIGACLGAMAGAMVGEFWKGRSVEESWQIGRAAFHGRLTGSVIKIALAAAMVAVGLCGVLLR